MSAQNTIIIIIQVTCCEDKTAVNGTQVLLSQVSVPLHVLENMLFCSYYEYTSQLWLMCIRKSRTVLQSTSIGWCVLMFLTREDSYILIQQLLNIECLKYQVLFILSSQLHPAALHLRFQAEMNRLDSVEESRQRLTEIEAILAQSMQVKFMCNFFKQKCYQVAVLTALFCIVCNKCILNNVILISSLLQSFVTFFCLIFCHHLVTL